MVTSLKVKKMKLLYCVRLFSGLTSSIIKESWNPQGAPTIYRFIEAVDKKRSLSVGIEKRAPCKLAEVSGI